MTWGNPYLSLADSHAREGDRRVAGKKRAAHPESPVVPAIDQCVIQRRCDCSFRRKKKTAAGTAKRMESIKKARFCSEASTVIPANPVEMR